MNPVQTIPSIDEAKGLRVLCNHRDKRGGCKKQAITNSHPFLCEKHLAQKEEQDSRKCPFDKELLETGKGYDPENKVWYIDIDRHTIDETLARDCFLIQYGKDLIHRQIEGDDSILYAYDKTTGMYSCNKHTILSVIEKSKLTFIPCQDSKEENGFQMGKSITKYSGTIAGNELVYAKLKLIDPSNFLKDNTSDKGKLLWEDGIYDFATNTFTEGFDEKIVFKQRINRKFPINREILKDKIEGCQNIFNSLFNEGTAKYFSVALARGLYGDTSMRKSYFCMGNTASGKGLLTGILRNTFEDYISTFNSNNLLTSKSSKDDAQRLMWLIPIRDSRLSISNEMHYDGTDNLKIIGKDFKSIVSDGDEIQVRGMNQNAFPIVNRATLVFMANDYPDFDSKEGIENRIDNILFEYSFVDKPEGKLFPTEKKIDTTLKDKFNNDDWKNAFFWFMANTYQEYLQLKSENKLPILPIDKEVEENKNEKKTFDSVFNQFFEFSEEPNAKVSNELFNKIFKDQMQYSDTKTGIEFTKFCKRIKLNADDFKYSDGKKRYRIGIKYIPPPPKTTVESATSIVESNILPVANVPNVGPLPIANI